MRKEIIMGIAALAVAAIGSTYARFMQQDAHLNVAATEISAPEIPSADSPELHQANQDAAQK